MNQPPVPILMYHQVTPQPLPFPIVRRLAVSPDAFGDQMDWLQGEGYQPITLDQLLANRQGKEELPERPIVLTFDDGYQDFVDHAAPILQRHTFTATLFLVAGAMGLPSPWLIQEFGAEVPLFDWAAARQLEAAGFRCEAHTLLHPHLPELSAEACRKEIAESRTVIAHELGREVHHFAYPYGDHNPLVRAMVIDAGYQTACSVDVGLSPPDDDPFALHRVHVDALDTLDSFAERVRTGGDAVSDVLE